MKTISVLLFTLLAGSWAQASTCKTEVYSKGVLAAVDQALQNTINREENAYQNPLSLVSYTAPTICGYYPNEEIMIVSTDVVFNEIYVDDGATKQERTDTCEVTVQKVDKAWEPIAIFCYELEIDKDL